MATTCITLLIKAFGGKGLVALSYVEKIWHNHVTPTMRQTKGQFHPA
ncbi:MAG: hypothetical protein ACRDE8_05055 [Ginsengibacter sp.]